MNQSQSPSSEQNSDQKILPHHQPTSCSSPGENQQQPSTSMISSLDQQSSTKERKTVSFDNFTKVRFLPDMEDIDKDTLFWNDKELEEFKYDAWIEEKGLANKGMVTKACKFVLRII